MENPRITFKTGETKQLVHIMMPSTSVKEEEQEEIDGKKDLTADELEEKEAERGSASAFFMVELKHPAPDGLRLSRKNICFVEIRPQSQATDKILEEQRA